MSWWPREINVEKLKENPVVEYVDYYGVDFIFEFRIKLFEMWKLNPAPETIKTELEKVDILPEDLNVRTIDDIAISFQNNGYPMHKKAHPETEPGFKETNPLILSGKYFRLKKGRGLRIDPEFRITLKNLYPDVPVEDGMRCNGLNPLDVGGSRIRRLTQEFDSEMSADYLSSEGINKKTDNGVTALSLMEHPYVKLVEHGNLYMTDSFFDEAYIIPVPLSKVFEIYGIDGAQVSEASKMRIYSELKTWKPSNAVDFPAKMEILMIQRRRVDMMYLKVKEFFSDIGKVFELMKLEEKRKVCRWIDNLPRDPWGYFSRKKILEIISISKSRYYALLNDEDYGTGSIKKADQDEEDIAVIRKVLEYKGFEKGIRQVYMLMPRVTDRYFSMYRIRRLMNKYGIRTTIRHPSRNRKAMKELIERNRKANLIMRRFRLHRPNEVRLTDVTYLDYGNGKRAYGSASVDPVTGRLICFIVSENNDLKLALDTLEAMDSYPAKSGAILHSDQGMIYMTDDFQSAVVEKELTQSMSRRGNCWDNAVQESFFGHFKDECHYEKCKTLKELQKCIDKYSFYYNNERGMWDKGRMTPTEYEEYLEGMSEAEFSEYLVKEEKRFADMKAKSAENAHKVAKRYKEFTSENTGGLHGEAGGSFKEI